MIEEDGAAAEVEETDAPEEQPEPETEEVEDEEPEEVEEPEEDDEVEEVEARGEGILDPPVEAPEDAEDALYLLTHEGCAACAEYLPHFREIVDHLPVVWYQTDIEEFPDFAKWAGVTSTPLLVVIRGGYMVERHEGGVGEADLRRIVLEQLRETFTL